MSLVQRLSRAVADRPGPLAVLDMDAFDANAEALVSRSHGRPIRLATKSVRCRELIERALAHPGFSGLMCYSVAEAHWLATLGHDDILVAYPSTDAPALRALAADPEARGRVVVMGDSIEYVQWLVHHVPDAAHLGLALDVDASLRLGRGRVHLGARRSPLRRPEDVLAVVDEARAHGIETVGLMFYDAQIAGVADSSPAVRLMKRRSHAELLERRREIVQAVRSRATLVFVNGGGTGSLHLTGLDASLTELAAGSGLYAPTLFDGYDGLDLTPALYIGTDVVRRPDRDVVTTFAGGYVASGPPGWSRVLTPVPGQDLDLVRAEGTGEVQTPLRGPGAARLGIGDRVWFRPAKAGEVLEHFTQVILVCADTCLGTALTYRGEGRHHG